MKNQEVDRYKIMKNDLAPFFRVKMQTYTLKDKI